VEICCRDDRQVIDAVGGKIIEVGGPDGKPLSTSVSTGGRGWDKRLTCSIYLPRNHGACPQVLGHQEVYPQSTLLRGHDPGILPGEITRELVHRHPGSGKSPSHLVHVALMRRG
jgi:hypothetical protein